MLFLEVIFHYQLFLFHWVRSPFLHTHIFPEISLQAAPGFSTFWPGAGNKAGFLAFARRSLSTL
jgi:hypothetical protein